MIFHLAARVSRGILWSTIAILSIPLNKESDIFFSMQYNTESTSSDHYYRFGATKALFHEACTTHPADHMSEPTVSGSSD